ncbi:MAG: hypothetical protein ACREC0_05790 [Methylocella sp.]
MVAAVAVQAVSATARWRDVQFHGGHSSRRFSGRSRGFARTPASQASGSASFNSRVSIGVCTAPAPRPPASESANVRLPLPMAMPARGPSGGGGGATDAAIVEEPGDAGPALQAVSIRSYN